MNNFSTGFSNAERPSRLGTAILLSLALLAAFILSPAASYAQVQIGSTNYTTLYDALDAINQGTHTGNITVLITGNTTEINQPALLSGTTAPANWTSVTIRPSGGQWTITGNSSYECMAFGGASNVTIDGSLTPGGTTRDLTLSNIGTAATSGGMLITLCSNMTVKNLNVYNSDPSISYGIIVDASSNCTVENCRIYRADLGIVGQATSSNLTITKNKIGGFGDNSIAVRRRGIHLNTVSTYSITDNEINTVYNSTFAGSIRGITAEEATDGLIARNKVHKVYNTNGGGYGIYIYSATTGRDVNTTVSNNFVSYCVSLTAYPLGIGFNLAGNIKLYNNTIHLYGENTVTGYFSVGMFWNPTTTSNYYVKNNIIKLENSGSSATGLYCWEATSPFTELDYNDYAIVSETTNNIGYFGGYRATLSDWQAAISADANSVDYNPSFVADDDLHLNDGSVGNSNLMAPELSAVANDIDGEARNSTTYMGADEVNPTIAFYQNLIPFESPFCGGDQITMTVEPEITGYLDNIARDVTNPSFTYEWYHNGELIEGATEATYTIPSAAEGDGGSYYVIATLGNATITSNTINVEIQMPLGVVTQPSPRTDACEGSPSFDISVETQGTVTGYQWQKLDGEGWMDIEGANSSVLTLTLESAEQTEGLYRVRIIGPGTCGAREIYSEASEVVVTTPLSNARLSYEFIPDNVCFGDNIAITANVEGTVMGYQWQVFEDGEFKDLNLKAFPTANQQTLVINDAKLEQSGRYRAVIIGSPNCSTSVAITEEININIWPLFEIAEQPKSDLVCRGGKTSLTVIALGTVYNYQWMKDGVDITLAENPTAKSPILSMENMNEKASGTYTARLTIQDCRGIRDIYTVPALVYVLEDTKIMSVTSTNAVSIGEKATFEVKAHVQGAPGTYNVDVQWYRGNQALSDDDRYSGTKSSILTIRDVQPSDIGNDYWVTVSGLCGSDVATGIELFSPGVDIIMQPATRDVCLGENTTLSVEANPVGGGQTLTYQWYRNSEPITNGGNITGANTNTLTINAVTENDQFSDYYVIITVQPGNVTAQSIQAAVNVISPPVIATQPEAAIALDAGSQLSINVAANGDNLSYQWYKDDVEIIDAIAPTYIKEGVIDTDAGVYRVRVYNNCGEVMSTTTTVTINNNRIQLGMNDINEYEINLVNEPNPFNNTTNIKFAVKAGEQARLTVTDLYGREIAVLFDGASTGNNTIVFDAGRYNLTSGVYYYTLSIGNNKISKSMMLVK